MSTAQKSQHIAKVCLPNAYNCINISVTHYELLCFHGNKSCVLIRDPRGVNAQLLLMLVTTHHVKHIPNYEYLTSARIMHIFESVRVGKFDKVIKYSAPIFSSFLQCFVKFIQ